MGKGLIVECVKISPVDGGYELIRDFEYKDIVVPKGFVTNGIDLKTRVLSLFINKYDPITIEAVVVHDYLCELEQYAKADLYFQELLPNIWQKPFMLFLVKIYHKFKYGV